MRNSGIAVGGHERLLKAVEEQVHRKYQAELAAATDHSKRSEIGEKIRREIDALMKSLASPYSLWSSH